LGTSPQIWGKAGAVWRHVAEYDAAKPFHVPHEDPMSGDAVSNQLLNHHLCVAMPLFGLGLAKSWALLSKFGAKLVLFGGMWQNMMLPNHSMSSIWVQ
jgi:hypothetical protein